MFGNASADDDSPLHLSGVNSFFLSQLSCLLSRPDSIIFCTSVITNILLLLPLCIFILCHGLQQCRKWRSTSSAASMSHSDSFTFHMVTMEMVGIPGCILSCCGICRGDLIILLVGGFFSLFTWHCQMYIHVLTCVERHLAVVHPITYLSLRNERGIRIRNVAAGCVWLLSLLGTGSIMLHRFIIFDFCGLILCLTIIAFCSLSVLHVLIRPGPGEQGGNRERVDQSKQRAFYTIMAILGTLVLRCVWSVVWVTQNIMGEGHDCKIMAFAILMNLPSSLVLPLLYLHRAGKLVCGKNDAKRGRGSQRHSGFTTR